MEDFLSSHETNNKTSFWHSYVLFSSCFSPKSHLNGCDRWRYPWWYSDNDWWSCWTLWPSLWELYAEDGGLKYEPRNRQIYNPTVIFHKIKCGHHFCLVADILWPILNFCLIAAHFLLFTYKQQMNRKSKYATKLQLMNYIFSSIFCTLQFLDQPSQLSRRISEVQHGH